MERQRGRRQDPAIDGIELGRPHRSGGIGEDTRARLAQVAREEDLAFADPALELQVREKGGDVAPRRAALEVGGEAAQTAGSELQ